MKLVFFDDFKLGVVKDGAVVDVSYTVSSIPHQEPHELINRLIAGFSQHKQKLIEVANERTGVPLAQVKLGPGPRRRPSTPSINPPTPSLGTATP
jgi:hypothetical protein